MANYKRPPRLQQHRDGRYFTRIDGEFHSLGTNAALAARRFAALLEGQEVPVRLDAPTVGDVVAAWLLERGPQVDDRQCARMREAVACLTPWHGLPAGQFDQLHLDSARKQLLARPSKRNGAGLSRNYVNRIVGLVQTCWRWAAGRRLVTAVQCAEVCTLKALRTRQGGREVPDRQPASPAHLEAALACMGRVAAAMVRLQCLTGMRPGEVCALTPGEVNREGFEFEGERWWVYSPGQHKGSWRGTTKFVVLSPAAQAVLLPFLDRDVKSPCFSPKETDRPGNARHDHYSPESYCQAVGYACARAGVPPWTPHQLRHHASTTARDRGASREDTAALLGHADVQTTDDYTHALLQAAARAARNLS